MWERNCGHSQNQIKKKLRKIQATLLLALCLSFASTPVLTLKAVAGGADCSVFLGSCEYYRCLETQEYSCGESGYLLRFGYRYCQALEQKVKPKFSVRGQEWMNDAGRCLREALVPLDSRNTSCSQLEDLAIASHMDCYIGTGFCDISTGEKIRILTFIWPELFNPKIRRVVREIQKACRTSSPSLDSPPWLDVYLAD